MAKELFRPKFSPPGMSYADAKAQGLLREAETWWIRLRHQGRTIRESTKTSNFTAARNFLSKKKASLARGEPHIKQSAHVTFSDMAKRLREDYEINGKHMATLEARLARLEPAFGNRRLSDLRPDDVVTYIAARHGAGATNGTINRELEVLARAFALGRKLGLTTAALRVRDHRLAEAAPRAGFFERDAFESVLRHLTRGKKSPVPAEDLRLACAIGATFGWRMQSEILTLEKRQIDLNAASNMGTLTLDPGSTKNEDARVVVLTPDLRSAIVAQLGRLDAFQKQTGRVVRYLFTHMSGPHRGERIRDFKGQWRAAVKKAGVAGRLRHDFRRTAVRNMVNAGVPERVAMEITGHKTRSVFDRYHIVSQADHVRAARLLAEAQAEAQGAKSTGPKPHGQEPGKVGA